MVVFTCNACGDALKKAQVEKHYQTKCRSCNVVSCIDCGKDFWGNDYEQHTKCISEEEKYSGKNYVPKANANKGEVKQQAWLQQVQTAIDKVKTNPKLKALLERMKDYPNIPRKKSKFENFLSNSLKVWDKSLAASVWELLLANAELKPTSNSSTDQNGKNTNQPDSSNCNNVTNHAVDSEQVSQSNDSEGTKKLNKRERKEERKKKSHKAEKKEKHVAEVNGVDNEENESGRAIKSKKKKRKHGDEDTERRRKKRKQEDSDEEVIEDNGEAEEVEEAGEPDLKRYKTTFDWEDIITRVLKAKGSEMAIKKVKKKVLAEYLAQGCTEKSEERLWAKFDKKIRKNPAFKIVKDRVKLSL